MIDFVRIGRFILDVAITESHTFEADVTEYPVESGATVTDNIRPKPIKISIEGIVTDTPLGSNTKTVVLNDASAKTTSVVGLGMTDLIAAGIAQGIAEDLQLEGVTYLRSEQAFKYLKQVWESRDTVTVVTSMGTFENMAMTSFDVPRSKETTGGLKFTASFQQIQKVTNTRVRSAIRNGTGKRHRGNKGGDSKYWYRDEVTWRRGFPPGSDNIVETILVRYYLKPSEPLDAQPRWFFWSGPQGAPTPQPLSDSEVHALGQDIARDKRNRLIERTLRVGSPYTGRTFLGAGGGSPTSNNRTPVRTSFTDMSEQSRKAQQESTQPNTKSGDPNFTNQANYVPSPGENFYNSAVKPWYEPLQGKK